MKKLGVFIVFFGLIFSAGAQVRVNAANTASQPLWGPAGYHYAAYYYFPEINVYYETGSGNFIFFNRGQWIPASKLPDRFGKPDLFAMHKVVLNERNPYLNNTQHLKKYPANYKYGRQDLIRDQKYTENTVRGKDQSRDTQASGRNDHSGNGVQNGRNESKGRRS